MISFIKKLKKKPKRYKCGNGEKENLYSKRFICTM